MEKTAVIIHGRTRYGDYREKLLVHPADMTEEEVYAWKQRLLQCTKSPEEMRAGHQIRRAVICDGCYLTLGVAAYFRDLYPGSFEDEGRRPVYGFVGFVWKREAGSAGAAPCLFPPLSAFADLVEQYVIPRWEEPKNGLNVEKATLSDYREYEFYRPESAAGSERMETEAGRTGEDFAGNEDQKLCQALERAERGETVFYCAGLPEEEPPEEESPEQQRHAEQETACQKKSFLYVRCLCQAAVLLLSMSAALFLPSAPGKGTAGIMAFFFLYRIVQNLRQMADECGTEEQHHTTED